MLISAIITTRNRAGLLREAIESVLNQEACGADTELIVVDDDSSDETADVVASYPQAKYLRTKQGTAAGSRNVGIGQAQGDWIAFLDDDDVWLPHKLKHCCEAINQNLEAAFICSAATICDHQLSPGDIWAGPKFGGTRSAYEAFLEEVVTPSVVLIRKSVFDSVGLFDTRIPRVEDRDMWIRVALQGCQCLSLPEPLVLYRLREQADGRMDYETYLITMRVLKKFFSDDRTPHLTWKHRQQVLWRIRGWYANQLVTAAQQAQRQDKPQRAAELQRLALMISLPHSIKARMLS